MIKRKKICPFCHTKSDSEAYPRKRVKNHFFYDKCNICGGGVLKPKPTLSQMKKIYKGDKYFDGLGAPVKNGLLQWILTKKIYQTPSEWILSKFKNGRVLDVGCGNGEFLNDLKDKGWETWGSDVSSDAVKRTKVLLNEDKKIQKGELTKQNFSRRFDLISFWHVLEHLSEPRDYLLKARKLLTNKGCVVGELPNYDSAIFKIFGSSYAWVMIPDHTLYFTGGSLRRILKSVGFTKIKIYNPPRALLNFSISLSLWMQKLRIPGILVKLVMILSVPVSILFILVLSRFNKGEILRFEAQK